MQPPAIVGEHPDSTGLLSLSTPPESSYYTSCPTSASTVSRLRVFQVGSPRLDLRHSCIALLLACAKHREYVQHLASHATIPLTLERYSHWMPTMSKHTASAMDEVLDEADREDAPKDEKGALERKGLARIEEQAILLVEPK
jgi:hypothetical protein